MADAAFAAALARIEATLGELREDISTLATLGRLTADERRTLEMLCPAAASIVNDSVFNIAELYEVPSLMPALAGYSARSLGWLFLRGVGGTHGGYRIARVGRDARGILWRLYPTR